MRLVALGTRRVSPRKSTARSSSVPRSHALRLSSTAVGRIFEIDGVAVFLSAAACPSVRNTEAPEVPSREVDRDALRFPGRCERRAARVGDPRRSVVNNATALPMLKLALAALERDVPNIDLARGVLRDVVGDERVEGDPGACADASAAESQSRRAVPIKRAAALLSLCPKTVRNKIARGEIPVIGAGRATRVLMPDAIDALAQQGTASRRKPVEVADPIADEAVAYVRSRTRLRAVAGGKRDGDSRATRSGP